MATDISDLRLHVRIDQGEGPAIVLLHGINSDADDMQGLIDALGTGYRLIAPDLLGFGKSPKPLDIAYSADEHARVLESTLTDLGVTGRFLLVGYSLGGVIAARYGATYPDRLRRLFLLSAPFYLPPEAYSKRGFGLEYAQAMLFTWAWKFVGRQKQRDTPLYELAAGPLRQPVQDFMRTSDVSQHWDVMALNLENAISPASLIEDLPRLSMPTVFALGVRDPIVRPDQTLALQRIKPDLEVRRIMGLTADHLLVRSTPERVAAEILRDEVDTLSVGLRTGSGDPLVLLPDLQETWRTWRRVAEDLGAHHDVAVLDLLGFGDSPAPLTNRYTVEDHAAAVLATAREAFGGRPFRVAGVGFGADVAIACASADPQAVTGAVAFAPLLPDTDRAVPDRATAQLLASRDTLLAGARDERLQLIATERLERRVVPAARSMTALLSASASRLFDRLGTPVRVIVPGSSAEVPDWLVARAQAQPAIVSVDSTPGVAHPERSSSLVAAAVRGEPLPPITVSPDPIRTSAKPDRLSALLGGLNARLVARGVLQTLLGLPLLLWPGTVTGEIVTAILAVWLGLESAQTLTGAVGLRRRGRPWLMWAALGLVGLAFALAVVSGQVFALHLVSTVIMIGAALRGVALLIVAAKASRTPGRRWVLVLDGLLSVAIAAAILVWPALGARLLRYAVGGYLTASGLSSLAFAYGNARATRDRVRRYLERPY